MTIHALVSLSLHKQPQNLPLETLGIGKKKKTMHFQKYNQEPVEEGLRQSLRAKRRGLKRLQNKGLKV